jgi:hypothetical protein
MSDALKRSSGSKSVQTGSGSSEESSDTNIRSFTLRVHGGVIDQVDNAVSNHPVIRNRNTWIVNAIVEQLKRDRQS